MRLLPLLFLLTPLLLLQFSGESKSSPTYYDNVEPILRAKCLRCHREGGGAPFSLEGYKSARKWARMMPVVLAEVSMPPWYAEQGDVEMADDCRVTTREENLLRNWFLTGCSIGDLPGNDPANQLIEASAATSMQLKAKQSFRIPASGVRSIAAFELTPRLTQSRVLSEVRFNFEHPDLVTHAELRLETRNGRNEVLYLWSPLTLSHQYPEGAGVSVPVGSKMTLIVHYRPSGREEMDRPTVNLSLAKLGAAQVDLVQVSNSSIGAGTGETVSREREEWQLNKAGEIYWLAPELGLLGRAGRVILTTPEGSTRCLLVIGRWDVDWSTAYWLKEPFRFPKGSVLRVEATYNSPSNLVDKAVRSQPDAASSQFKKVLALHAAIRFKD